jgi:amidase
VLSIKSKLLGRPHDLSLAAVPISPSGLSGVTWIPLPIRTKLSKEPHTPSSPPDVTGEWSLQISRFGQEIVSTRLELRSEGNRFTGTVNELTLEGTIEGDHLLMIANGPYHEEFASFAGRLQGQHMTGTVEKGGEQLIWKAHRVPVVKGAPQMHTFEPTTFHHSFSGTIAPVLHINPGDTIKTFTVDAWGVDAKNVRSCASGNPQTGPFFIEGAMPGDTLVITFCSIRLNRDSAQSGGQIVPNAVQPDYFRTAEFDDEFDSEWKLDLATGIAGLAKPTERLKNWKVKLRPMLGCVSVAPPAKQSFRSWWLGSWGGNMDYFGVREGTTVYLPVYQEGALLFVGDGHALQGAGELNGDALETSMDLEFMVEVIYGGATQGPRFEDDEYLMASGIAGSLAGALQQATTELLRWLERDYELSANESSLVLGTSIRYDIAQVVNPQIHVVAKVSKTVLAGLK